MRNRFPDSAGRRRPETGIEVLRILREKQHRLNANTAVHIHVGYANQPKKQIERLIAVVAYLEPALYAITGTKKRERGCYCQSVQKYGGIKNAYDRLANDRYHLLNTSNLTRHRLETVEFRCFSGSLNPVKILGWIQICLGVVERGLTTKRLPRWKATPPIGGWAKKGPGESESQRIWGFLGWGRGYQRLKGGHQYGWLTDCVPQDEIKKEMTRLAKKYDAEN